MSRRHRAEKREIFPDPKFGDLVISKFMNNLMKEGKKSVAEKIVYGAFDDIEKKLNHNDTIQVNPNVSVETDYSSFLSFRYVTWSV